jgi:hypothetical protein
MEPFSAPAQHELVWLSNSTMGKTSRALLH